MKWTETTYQHKPALVSDNGEYMITNEGKKGGDDYILFVRGYNGIPELRSCFCTRIHRGTLNSCKTQAEKS